METQCFELMRYFCFSCLCVLRVSGSPLLVFWSDAQIWYTGQSICQFVYFWSPLIPARSISRMLRVQVSRCSGHGVTFGTNIWRIRSFFLKGGAKARKQESLDGRRDTFPTIFTQFSVKPARLENRAPVHTGESCNNSKPIKNKRRLSWFT